MRGAYKLFYILAYPVFRLLFPLRVHNRERIPDAPMLVCANHSALSDPIIICYALGFRRFIRFMAKAELMRIPVLGGLLKSAGTFGVERGNSDIGAVKTALRILKDGGNVGIFPEGRRVHDERGSTAKTGAVMLAAKTGAWVLPVYIPRVKRLFSKVDVVIGEPYRIENIRGGAQVYGTYAGELMEKIAELGEQCEKRRAD